MFRLFEQLVNGFGDYDRSTPRNAYFAYLLSHLEAYRLWIALAMLASTVVALMEAGLIFYSGRIIDLMGAAGPAAFWDVHGTEVLLAATFVLLVRPVLFLLHALLLNQTLTSNLASQAHWRAHRHLLGQSMGFFQNDFAGRLANRVIQLGGAVEDSVFLFIEALAFFFVYIVGAMLILAGTNVWLAAPVLVWTLVYAAYAWYMAVRVGSASERMSRARSNLTGRIVDAYTNIASVKLFADSGREEAFALQALKRHRLTFRRFLRLMTEQSFVLNVMNGVLILSVMTPAVLLWRAGSVSLGEVAAAAALTLRLNGMSGWIMWVTINLFEHAGTIREGLESISVPHAVTDAPGAQALAVTASRLEFRSVRHHYGKGAGGLDRLSLTIPGGQKVGLVGRSGAGKSTLVNLLLRFHDTEGGRIVIDGQDIASVTQDSLRRQIGMVTQDSSLLHRSVRDNIRYGRPDATMDEVIAAARKAEAHDFITTLRDPKGRQGYDAQVGERGVKLSGGQRQRITLARVILKDAPILVLDEATSALDSEVEAAIQSTLYGVMEGKTVIAIAHRLSTIARMDRIVVIEDGRVVEDGSHADLLSRGGLYSGFWTAQSGGFLGLDGKAARAAE
jgi:ATP-binding cassette subfamily B multidrug efflux pump